MTMTDRDHATLVGLAADVRSENPRLARVMLRGSARHHRPGRARCTLGVIFLMVATLLAFTGGTAGLITAGTCDVLATVLLRPYVNGVRPPRSAR